MRRTPWKYWNIDLGPNLAAQGTPPVLSRPVLPLLLLLLIPPLTIAVRHAATSHGCCCAVLSFSLIYRQSGSSLYVYENIKKSKNEMKDGNVLWLSVVVRWRRHENRGRASASFVPILVPRQPAFVS